MVTNCCRKPAKKTLDSDFGFLCVREFDSYKEGEILEGGYAFEGLGTRCGDAWGSYTPIWQLVCMDCLKRAGYIW